MNRRIGIISEESTIRFSYEDIVFPVRSEIHMICQSTLDRLSMIDSVSLSNIFHNRLTASDWKHNNDSTEENSQLEEEKNFPGEIFDFIDDVLVEELRKQILFSSACKTDNTWNFDNSQISLMAKASECAAHLSEKFWIVNRTEMKSASEFEISFNNARWTHFSENMSQRLASLNAFNVSASVLNFEREIRKPLEFSISKVFLAFRQGIFLGNTLSVYDREKNMTVCHCHLTEEILHFRNLHKEQSVLNNNDSSETMNGRHKQWWWKFLSFDCTNNQSSTRRTAVYSVKYLTISFVATGNPLLKEFQFFSNDIFSQGVRAASLIDSPLAGWPQAPPDNCAFSKLAPGSLLDTNDSNTDYDYQIETKTDETELSISHRDLKIVHLSYGFSLTCNYLQNKDSEAKIQNIHINCVHSNRFGRWFYQEPECRQVSPPTPNNAFSKQHQTSLLEVTKRMFLLNDGVPKCEIVTGSESMFRELQNSHEDGIEAPMTHFKPDIVHSKISTSGHKELRLTVSFMSFLFASVSVLFMFH